MSGVTEHVDVAVPIRTAYNQWTQFEEFPHFMEGVKEVRQLSATATHWTSEIAGVKREFDAQVTEQVPDERVAWKSTDGTHHAGVITFHRLNDNNTRVTAQMEFDPHGVVEQAGDRLGVVERRVKGDLERFKKFIESRGGTETGAWRGEVPRPGA
jgi:uncharacterized membrane protein